MSLNTELNENIPKRRTKIKSHKAKYKKVAIFILFQLIFGIITFPLITFYGPFKTVRNMLVSTSMATGNHQYIAKTFFSDEEIQNILAEFTDEDNADNSDVEEIEVEFNSDGLQKIPISTNKFDGMAIIVEDPKRVKVGYSSKLGETGETVAKMAENYNAIAAVNGGGYSDVSPTGNTGGTGGIPLGILISDGKVMYPTDKKSYGNKETCVFGLDDNGKMFVGPASVNDLLEKNIKNAISFMPSLIINGKPHISENNLGGLNPRTAVGQREDGSIILLAIDGRQGLKLGATIKDVQTVMLSLGAVNAMCLDGGGSTTMYYNGEIINNPSSVTGARAVPNIVYVEP